MSDYQSDDDDLDRFVAAVNRALTEQFGPDHQRILSQGQIVSEFDWGQPKGTEAW